MANNSNNLKKPRSLRDLGSVTSDMFFTVPEHLKRFWQTYNILLDKGWFDNLERMFSGEENKTIKELCVYGLKLIHLVKEEQDLTKKHEYYIALAKLTDYLAGRLGNR